MPNKIRAVCQVNGRLWYGENLLPQMQKFVLAAGYGATTCTKIQTILGLKLPVYRRAQQIIAAIPDEKRWKLYLFRERRGLRRDQSRWLQLLIQYGHNVPRQQPKFERPRPRNFAATLERAARGARQPDEVRQPTPASGPLRIGIFR